MPSAQLPLPLQPPAHPRASHPAPVQPASHAHVVPVHVPCPLQSAGAHVRSLCHPTLAPLCAAFWIWRAAKPRNGSWNASEKN